MTGYEGAPHPSAGLLLTAWLCGLGPSVLALVLGSLAAPFFVLPSMASLGTSWPVYLVGLSFCCEPGVACYIPVAHSYAGAPQQLSREDVLERLGPWFADPTKKKVQIKPTGDWRSGRPP